MSSRRTGQSQQNKNREREKTVQRPKQKITLEPEVHVRVQGKRNRRVNRWKELLELRWVSYTVAACAAVLLAVLLFNLPQISKGLSFLYQAVFPVLIGIVIAYVINPLVNLIEKNLFYHIKNEKNRHTISVVLVLILVLLVLVMLPVTLIPSLGSSFEGILANMDSYRETIQGYIGKVSDLAAKMNLNISGLTASWDKFLNDFVKNLTSNLSTLISASYNLGMGAFNIVIGFILAVYFLLDKKNMIDSVNRLRHAALTDETYEKRTVFWTRCHDILTQYIGWSLIDGLIIGSINAVLMLIFRIPYVVLISVVVGVANLLPTFGPLIGAGVGGIILVLGEPKHAAVFLTFTFILQMFDGYILKPKMFGNTLGIPAVWILITIIVGGKMFGVVGILLAMPVAAIFTFLYEEEILPWLLSHKERRMEQQEADLDKPSSAEEGEE